MKNLFKMLGAKTASVLTALLVMALGSTTASAALPPEIPNLVTELGTDIGLLFAATVVLWATIRSLTAMYKIGNKFISGAGA